MEVADGRSSSLDLSSAPPSDAESTLGPLSYPTAALAHHDSTSGNLGVAGRLNAPHSHLPSPLHSLPAGAGASATSAGTRQESATPQATTTSAANSSVKVPKPRKKRDPNAPKAEKKERVVRRPRGASSAVASSRKKPKLEILDEGSTIHIPRPDSDNLQSSILIQPTSFSSAPAEIRGDDTAKYPQPNLPMHDAPALAQISSHRPYDYKQNLSASTAAARPSGIMPYDPIRSVTTHRPVDAVLPSSTSLQPTHTSPRPTYNPRASPAISAIIDHPAQSGSSNTAMLVEHPKPESPYSQTNGKAAKSPLINGTSSAMEVDAAVLDPAQLKKLASSKKVPSETPTRATSPKPARTKEQPPPPPPGSGLLSASLFGGDSGGDAGQKDSKGPNIVIHIDLKDPGNRVINFARMAEEKYGFAALYPRQAAQKERLAKVAAAGAALERSASGSKFGGTSAGESGDEDLSVDIERDSDNDGDVAMSGVNGGQETANSGTDQPGPKRRRRRKMEEYNQDDPFIDDSELLWEAQAAASKDGFFVYCGPLVPEGEKPAVERYVYFLSTTLLPY